MENAIEPILLKFPKNAAENIIEILLQIQQSEGNISAQSIVKVSEHIGIQSSKIYSLASFYDQFRFEQKATNIIRVCTGTTCYISGSDSILSFLEKELKIKIGETTRDHVFSIETRPCFGACNQSPVLEINGTNYSNLTTQKIRQILQLNKSSSQ
ncbi:MAG: NAD(P)H-dependent oxidoreductase subunit E [Bacteroidota bacterium]